MYLSVLLFLALFLLIGRVGNYTRIKRELGERAAQYYQRRPIELVIIGLFIVWIHLFGTASTGTLIIAVSLLTLAGSLLFTLYGCRIWPARHGALLATIDCPTASWLLVSGIWLVAAWLGLLVFFTLMPLLLDVSLPRFDRALLGLWILLLGQGLVGIQSGRRYLELRECGVYFAGFSIRGHG